jgi:hypothetical protein
MEEQAGKTTDAVLQNCSGGAAADGICTAYAKTCGAGAHASTQATALNRSASSETSLDALAQTGGTQQRAEAGVRAGCEAACIADGGGDASVAAFVAVGDGNKSASHVQELSLATSSAISSSSELGSDSELHSILDGMLDAGEGHLMDGHEVGTVQQHAGKTLSSVASSLAAFKARRQNMANLLNATEQDGQQDAQLQANKSQAGEDGKEIRDAENRLGKLVKKLQAAERVESVRMDEVKNTKPAPTCNNKCRKQLRIRITFLTTKLEHMRQRRDHVGNAGPTSLNSGSGGSGGGGGSGDGKGGGRSGSSTSSGTSSFSTSSKSKGSSGGSSSSGSSGSQSSSGGISSSGSSSSGSGSGSSSGSSSGRSSGRSSGSSSSGGGGSSISSGGGGGSSSSSSGGGDGSSSSSSSNNEDPVVGEADFKLSNFTVPIAKLKPCAVIKTSAGAISSTGFPADQPDLMIPPADSEFPCAYAGAGDIVPGTPPKPPRKRAPPVP